MEAVQVLSDYETERGKPMPSRNHALAQLYLITAFVRHKEEFAILPELSLELEGRPFVPDVSVYPKLSLASQTVLDWQHDEIRMTEPPAMAVEILSPAQPLDDLIGKAYAYLAAGVKSCWIVQPAFETITIFEPDKKPKTHTSGEVVDPATGITVKIEEIFRPID
jgi:Uma2 family endonuclease